MEKNIRRGSELNNVRETWEENERNAGNERSNDELSTRKVSDESELDKIVHEAAEDYDNENSEEKILTGERATVNDDDNT